MFRLTIICALAAVALARPSVYGEHLGLAAPLALEAHSVHVPAAISTSFRKDVIHKPVVTSYTVPEVVGHREVVEKVLAPAPIIQRTYVQPAPIIEKTVVQPAPIVEKTVIQPASESHVYRKDIIGKPIVSIHSAPVVHHAPLLSTVEHRSVAAPEFHSAYSGVHHQQLGYAAPLSYASHVPAPPAW